MDAGKPKSEARRWAGLALLQDEALGCSGLASDAGAAHVPDLSLFATATVLAAEWAWASLVLLGTLIRGMGDTG